MSNAPNPRAQKSGPPVMSLCDLIPALRSRQSGAQYLLARMDPAIFDALHALAAHRGMDTADLAAEFLEALVIEAADTAWRLGLARLSPLVSDPDAMLLGSALGSAMEVRLRRDLRIAATLPVTVATFGFIRSGWPYSQA
jgi:hypothetical protein